VQAGVPVVATTARLVSRQISAVRGAGAEVIGGARGRGPVQADLVGDALRGDGRLTTAGRCSDGGAAGRGWRRRSAEWRHGGCRVYQ